MLDWLAHPMASFYLVLIPAILLLTLGMVMVLSASSVYGFTQWGDAYYFVKRQVMFLALGGVGAFILARFGPRHLKVIAWALILGSLLLQILTFTPLGHSMNGNTNWVQFGNPWFRIQPSELGKLAIVMWGADIMARKGKRLSDPWQLLIPFLPVSLLLIVLVVLQDDLGTGMIMGALVLATLWYVGASLKVITGVIGTVALGVVGLVIASPNRMNRIVGFLNPTADPLGVNHQPITAIVALASGGWWGLGLGASRQKWGGLVESHTDYVFAVIGEELGLVGTLIVLALFVALGYAGFRIAMRSDDKFTRYTAAGVTSWFMIQALLNIAVVLRMVPVLGVPLPFLSYGGSALLANLMALGVLLACARNEPGARAYARKHRRRRGKALVATAKAGRS
ncbi:MAG: putative lipid II flippase FtsW [Actinobacteria bacterium HGW-Actinobacteria-2]|nr:MAG: putative lipid II flippase FtsW [Actinobacteria bacterium HGW-Actinobacteria-2]